MDLLTTENYKHENKGTGQTAGNLLLDMFCRARDLRPHWPEVIERRLVLELTLEVRPVRNRWRWTETVENTYDDQDSHDMLGHGSDDGFGAADDSNHLSTSDRGQEDREEEVGVSPKPRMKKARMEEGEGEGKGDEASNALSSTQANPQPVAASAPTACRSFDGIVLPYMEISTWVRVIRADPDHIDQVNVISANGERRIYLTWKNSFVLVNGQDDQAGGFRTKLVDGLMVFRDLFPASCRLRLLKGGNYPEINKNQPRHQHCALPEGVRKCVKLHCLIGWLCPVGNTSGTNVGANIQIDHIWECKGDYRASQLQYTGGNADNRNKPANGFRQPNGSYEKEMWLYNETVYQADCKTPFPFKDLAARALTLNLPKTVSFKDIDGCK